MFLVGIASLIVAMTVTWLVTPGVIRLAHWLGALDLPGGRKTHVGPVPRIGGLAVFLGFIAGLAFAAYTYLIAHEPGVRVSSYSLVNPAIATLLGLLVGDETPVPLLAAGLPLVLLGVTLMLYGEAIVAHLRSEATKVRGCESAATER